MVSISRTEIVGFIFALIVVGIMAFITFHGPFHLENKAAGVELKARPPATVKILSDPKTVGKYQPAAITVHIGQPLIWSNDSDADHTVTAANHAFDSGNISVNSTWQWTPTKTGTFEYGCAYHPLMHGVVVVVR
ncbi:MAG: cupredoxin domain-containing protein [Chloroflexota bacterium]